MVKLGNLTQLIPEEYIAYEHKWIPDEETVRNEYIHGKLISKSGASFAHNIVTINISTALHKQLNGSGCEIFANEMRVSSPLTTSYFYPDVGVVCDDPRFEDDVFDILLNPIVIVEVLSPSTEAYDRGEKFSHYRQIESLKEYILVSQDKVNVERYLRNTDEWILSYYQELDQLLELTSIQCEVSLQEIYDRVSFPE